MNADIARSVLGGDRGPRRDVVVLNAAAALDVAGVATSLEDGIEKAVESIDSGASSEVLRRWVDVSQGTVS